MKRRAHGKAARLGASVVIEVSPADELPIGVQAIEQVERKRERDAQGRLRPGSRTTQSKGGQALREQTRLARRMGLQELPDDADFKPYKRAAASFRRFHVSALARSVGGGYCGPGPSSVVATAAWQLAVSRYLFDQAAASGKREDFMIASRLANDSRQNLLAAHELCAREAQARPQPHDAGIIGEINREIAEDERRERDGRGS